MGYIYAIEDESARYKLGFADDVEKRLPELQVGNAERLTIKYRLQVKDMRRAEQSLHSIFAADRIRLDGEWFKIQNINLLKKIFNIETITEKESELLRSLGLR
jgi:Meiotically Up-regulated Gene 113 (MUG113) protein